MNVIAAHESHFNAFRAYLAKDQPRAARALKRIETATELLKFHKQKTIVVGPFWQHPHFDRIMSIILKRCQGRLNVAIEWFPVSAGQAIDITSSGLVNVLGQALPLSGSIADAGVRIPANPDKSSGSSQG